LPQKRSNTRGFRSLDFAYCFVLLLGPSRYILFWVVWTCISPDTPLNTGIQCGLLEAPLHGIQC